MSVVADDIKLMKSRENANLPQKLVAAARKSGKNPMKIALDYLRFRRGRGKLKLYEYLMYELYDTERWGDGERERFVSAHIHWPLISKCNNRTWWAVTEDKWLSSAVLQHNRIPVPKNVAVFDRSKRLFPDLPKLSTGEDLRTLLTGDVSFPLFAKNISGIWSAGAVRIESCTESEAKLSGKDSVTFDQLADEIFGEASYIIQECLTPHHFFEGITDATSTVRCLNLINEGGLRVPFTLLKLPMSGNIADNFWRSGNLLANISPETGEILSVTGNKDGVLFRTESLPGTSRQLVGQRLPHWDALRSLNEKVALLHAPNRYGSTDIALTDDGPVIVEVNNSCAFELIQIATGKGLLTDEILEFFRHCGVDI